MTAALVEASRDAWASCACAPPRSCNARPRRSTTPRRASAARQAGGAAITLAELMQATLTDGAVVGRGVSTKLPLGVEIGAHVCDVEVDTDTGQVTVLRYTAFQDVGLALNPDGGRGPDRGQRRAGPRLGADGGLRLRRGRAAAQREPARLSHADRARRAADRLRDHRDAGARTCPTACAASARCRSCRRPPPSPTPSPAPSACASRHMPMTPERVLAALQRQDARANG